LSPEFSKADSRLDYCTWDPTQDGFNSILESEIPCPAVKVLPHPLIEKKGKNYCIHYDILGLTYWMLSRIEEIDAIECDIYGRFCSSSSHASKNGYLKRPVVDEWLDILRQVISQIWPKLNLLEHGFEIKVTCDVDNPLLYNDSIHIFVRKAFSDLIKYKSIHRLVKRTFVHLLNKISMIDHDPFFQNIRKIMKICEKKNLRVNFYFIPLKRKSDNGIMYKMKDKKIKKILLEIQDRGHLISIHPSYDTCRDKRKLERDISEFQKITKSIGLDQKCINSRQHYLRWKHPETLDILDDLKVATDSTLYYADSPGFRCGTCYEYPLFNPIKQKITSVREIPLVLMEDTLLSNVYRENYKEKIVLNEFIKIRETCRKMNGKYVFLWHNCTLENIHLLEKLIS
jgi:hypothetical protein